MKHSSISQTTATDHLTRPSMTLPFLPTPAASVVLSLLNPPNSRQTTIFASSGQHTTRTPGNTSPPSSTLSGSRRPRPLLLQLRRNIANGLPPTLLLRVDIKGVVGVVKGMRIAGERGLGHTRPRSRQTRGVASGCACLRLVQSGSRGIGAMSDWRLWAGSRGGRWRKARRARVRISREAA